ncbi:MAG: metallophosphoesterase [Sphingobacteriaceae bacterium]|jgi:predicted MPP superfamily phosphohydrolase|nr:metallophosphoesterase [Sphingobacteriaceae bacterium]
MLRRMMLPLAILVSVSLLLDWYVSLGLATVAAAMENTEAARYIPCGWMIFSAALLFLLIYLFGTVFPKRRENRLFSIVMNTFLALFVAKLVFAIILLGGDVYRMMAAVGSLAVGNDAGMPERSLWLSSFGLLMSAVPLLAFAYGLTKGKYRYTVHRTTLYFDELPEVFDGFKIAQISDIHSGSFDDPEAVAKGVALLNAQKPDLFVFTGDMVNNKAEEIVPYIDIFSKVEAPYGRFSILGNHDYGDYVAWPTIQLKAQNLADLKRHHAEIGYRLLLDEHVWINKGDFKIALLGIENWGKGFGERGDLKKALQGVDEKEFKVLLSHDPSHWDAQVKNNPVKIHLTLSGHTHGMQFGIEIGKFKWSPVKYRYANWAGIAEENGRYLYVNRGFGFLGFQGRIGIWPEITIIELRKR